MTREQSKATNGYQILLRRGEPGAKTAKLTDSEGAPIGTITAKMEEVAVPPDPPWPRKP